MKNLAKAILKAQELREESIDKKAMNKAIKIAFKTNNPCNLEKFYGLTLWQAAEKAAELIGFDTETTQIIYLIIKNNYNDSQDWAKNYLKNS